MTFSHACEITLVLYINQCLLSFFWDFLWGAFKQFIELENSHQMLYIMHGKFLYKKYKFVVSLPKIIVERQRFPYSLLSWKKGW